MLATVDALDAQAAMGLDQTDQAAGLGARALERAERLDLPEVACEALEILGRCQRPHDLAAAEAAFTQAHSIADERGLAVWRVRALHELGTIDLLAGRGLDRLDEARAIAFNCGALATAAVLDVQLAAGLAFGDDPDQAVVVARRGSDLASRYRLDETLATALAFEAVAQARLGRRDALERCEQKARASTPGSTNLDMILGLSRAVLAFVEEDRAEAVRRLEPAAAIQSASVGDRASGPITGIWALVAAVEGHGDADELAWPSQEPVHFIGRGVPALRPGGVWPAVRGGGTPLWSVVAEGDQLLAEGSSWFRHYGQRLVAEAALADGWESPVAVAAGGAGLLRGAGRRPDRLGLPVAAPPGRRRRALGAAATRSCRPSCARIGVTGRELEVLRLLGEGLSNQEIGRPSVPVAPNGRAARRQPDRQDGRGTSGPACRLRRPVRRPYLRADRGPIGGSRRMTRRLLRRSI